ncbi:MAG: carbonic anhydrase, partial [Alphaproteobacteria bacterium]|nr:carbonic anhydrase [Alphaproteobacteria bacterium]
MKKNFFISLTLCSFLWITNGHAEENRALTETIKGAIKDLVEDNAAFANQKAAKDFKAFLDIQNPRVTMVLCSDSRVQTDNFSQGAENDVFVARNIGNQFITTAGSIEYGVNVLKTPVLMIVGHSHCGAIKAAMGDVASLPAGIRKEVETIDVKAAKDDKQGVIENVHYQVEKALSQFKD